MFGVAAPGTDAVWGGTVGNADFSRALPVHLVPPDDAVPADDIVAVPEVEFDLPMRSSRVALGLVETMSVTIMVMFA